MSPAAQPLAACGLIFISLYLTGRFILRFFADAYARKRAPWKP